MTPTPLQRALGDAPDKPKTIVTVPERELFLFRLQEFLFGVASEHVREVTRMGVLTPLPRMTSSVLGVAGHRGEVLPIIDLLRFLGVGEAVPAPRCRVFISTIETLSAAFIADTVIGLTRVPVGEIWPPPLNGKVANDLMLGTVTRGNEGDGTINILNLPRVLQAVRQRAIAR